MLMSKEGMPVMTSGADSTSTAVELVRTPMGLGPPVSGSLVKIGSFLVFIYNKHNIFIRA